MSSEAPKPKVSIVIPCFNQASALRETLARLAFQTHPVDDFEVIVVDDGSADDTQDVVSSFSGPYRLRFFSQDHKGAAAARNLGAVNASGQLLIFLDADMIAEPDLIVEHIKEHGSNKRAIVVGNRKPWPPAQKDLFSKVIDIDSNVPATMRESNLITYREAFTCNVSIKNSDFQKIGGFDEKIHRWEDIDFAYRAQLLEFPFKLNPNAIAYHNHPISFKEFCKKMYEHYYVAIPIFSKHPGMIDHFSYLTDKRPIHWGKDSPTLIIRKLARRAMAFQPALSFMEKLADLLERKFCNVSLLRFFYWKIIGSYELIGLREGSKKHHAWI